MIKIKLPVTVAFPDKKADLKTNLPILPIPLIPSYTLIFVKFVYLKKRFF
jgi:hypothetical protein